MKKRILSLALVLIMICTLMPLNAFASNAYYINGKYVHWDDYSSSPNECWVYAQNIYNKIWGTSFSSYRGTSDDSLRNLSMSELTLTEAHLKAYVSNAAVGSCLRICNSEYFNGGDGWGHSQIIVQKDSGGFTVFEGGLSAYPYCREKYYTWSEYINTGWLGGTYSYIKYIKWPGADAYGGSTPANPDMWCTDINMPSTIVSGNSFSLTGNICGNNGVKWYALVIYDSENNDIQNVQEGVWEIEHTNSHSINTLAQRLDFSSLAPGNYNLSIQSMDNSNNYFGAYYKSFTVVCSQHNYKDGVCTVCGEKDPNYKPAIKFTDVDTEGRHLPFADAIQWAAAEGITTGYGNGIFAPDKNCSRAQVVTFLWRAAGEPEPKSAANPFVDVSAKQANGKDNPFYTAILWAVGEGITNGVDSTHFAPDATVTRAQFVTFLWRYENKPAAKPGVTLTDINTVTNADFKASILWAAGEGITTGYPDGSFRPNAGCTRAHVVTFIYRDMT